jgi:hypothetical protein
MIDICDNKWKLIGEITKKLQILTFGDGTTENVSIILSGYSSRILEMRSVPIPDPVPPPSECVSWNPYETLSIVHNQI